MKTRSMKTRSITELAEPLAYIILVAVFGFITTVVNHTRSTTPVRDSELVILNMESQFGAMQANGRQGQNELSL